MLECGYAYEELKNREAMRAVLMFLERRRARLTKAAFQPGWKGGHGLKGANRAWPSPPVPRFSSPLLSC